MSQYPNTLSPTDQLAAKTLQAAFRILKDAGGKLSSSELFRRIAKEVKFTPWEKEVYTSDGSIRWQIVTRFQSIGAVKGGYIIKENRSWTLTKEGEKLIGLPPAELLQRLKGAMTEWSTSQKSTKDIRVVHKEVFDFLLKKHRENPDFKFVLRSKDHKDRLQKGYWFLGNENYVCLSFWTGTDWKNKTPNIFFNIMADGSTFLALTGQDSEKKASFLKSLAKVIPGFKQQKLAGQPVNYWQKNYADEGGGYMSSLESFLAGDKEQIDAVIELTSSLNKETLDGIGFIPAKEFDRKLSKVLDQEVKKHATQVVKKPVGNSVKLSFVQLEDIGHFRTLSIPLHDRVTCIIGENGTGKSTVLRAIALGLAGVDETPAVREGAGKLQHMLRIMGERDAQVNYAKAGSIVVEYKVGRGLYVNKIALQSIPGKGVDLRDEEGDFEATKNENEFRSLVIGFPQVQGKSGGPVMRIKEKITAPNVGDIRELLFDEPDFRIGRFSDWIVQLYSKALHSNYTKKQAANELQIIHNIFELISSVAGEKVSFKDVDYDNGNIWITTKDAPNGILLDLISQGFRNIFGWIGYFMMRLFEANPGPDFLKAPAVVLIDEIDTYLHPKWQLTILDSLLDKFPNTQFIVTTHSPLVVSNLKQENVVQLDKQKNGEVVAVPIGSNPYGGDVNRILEQVMDTDERMERIKKKLKRFFNLIDEGKLEEARKEKDKLAKELDPSDPDLLRGEMLIETKRLLKG